LSPDPLGLAGGMFRTRYAEGDGVNLVDPTGWLANGLSSNDPSEAEYKDDDPTTGTDDNPARDGHGEGKSFCSENAFACGGNDAGGGDVLRKMLILRQDGEEAEGEVEAGKAQAGWTRRERIVAQIVGRVRTMAQNVFGSAEYDEDGTPMHTMVVWGSRDKVPSFFDALTASPILDWIDCGGPQRLRDNFQEVIERNTTGEGAAPSYEAFARQTMGEFLRMMTTQVTIPREENPILATSSPYHMATNMAADVQDAVHAAIETSPQKVLTKQSERYLASTVQIDPNATLAAMGFMAAVALATPGQQAEQRVIRIGLGLDDALINLRGTGAITYKNAGWQRAGLTRVDWGRASMDDYYFRQSFNDAAKKADGITFDVTGFDPGYKGPSITSWEFKTIVEDPALFKKTTFIRDGEAVMWTGTELVTP
jgi:hypothetical protein